MVINFIIVQFAPGGPVEQALAEAAGFGGSSTASISSAAMGPGGESGYTGSSGMNPELVARLEKQFGFDKPAHERFFMMIWSYAQLDFAKRQDDLHAALFDITMPTMSGVEALHEVQVISTDIPVLLMTGHEPDAEWDVQLAAALIRKPFTRDDILEALQHALAGTMRDPTYRV